MINFDDFFIPMRNRLIKLRIRIQIVPFGWTSTFYPQSFQSVDRIMQVDRHDSMWKIKVSYHAIFHHVDTVVERIYHYVGTVNGPTSITRLGVLKM